VIPFLKIFLDAALSKKREGDLSQSTPVQTLRADAQRNYDVLLDAAARVFAEEGVDAPVKEIAARAGVGVGTVYRRFPTRSDLIVAVFRHEVEVCVGAADVLSGEYEPFEAVTRWIARYQDLILTKRGLAAALHSDEPTYAALPTYFEATLVPPLTRLLDAAAADIRTEVSARELLRAIALLCGPATQGDVGQTRRLVALLLNGLTV
jgi:AcrR family transcriptional regulator